MTFVQTVTGIWEMDFSGIHPDTLTAQAEAAGQDGNPVENFGWAVELALPG